MNELDQLLAKLTELEEEREREREREITNIRDLSTIYQEQLKILANSLVNKLKTETNDLNMLNTSLDEMKQSQKKIITLLTMLSNQQNELIKLLKQPSDSEDLKKTINTSLNAFILGLTDTLKTSLAESNRQLVEELKALNQSTINEMKQLTQI